MKDNNILDEVAFVRANAERVHSEGAVIHALDRMAVAITQRLAGRNPLLLCVMTGGVMTTTWLVERLAFALQIDYIHATRYAGDVNARKEAAWIARPRLSLIDRHVLLVDDIYDEGVTMRRLMAFCRDSGAASMSSAVLVRKRHDRDIGRIEPDFVGLEVDDRYIFGCGLDYKNYLRNLPAIYAVPEKIEHYD